MRSPVMFYGEFPCFLLFHPAGNRREGKGTQAPPLLRGKPAPSTRRKPSVGLKVSLMRLADVAGWRLLGTPYIRIGSALSGSNGRRPIAFVFHSSSLCCQRLRLPLSVQRLLTSAGINIFPAYMSHAGPKKRTIQGCGHLQEMNAL